MHAGHHVFAHIPHVHFFRLPKEVEHFYLLAFVRTILTVTGGLFFPLYIYKETGSLVLVFVYMLLSQGLAKLPLRPLNLYVLSRLGIEWAMFLSIVLAGTEYFFAYFLGMGLAAVFFYGVLEGLSNSLYWDAYHMSFGVFGKERESAEEVAGLQVLQNIVSIILPVVSAAVISIIGFHRFYALVFVVTLLAAAYLLFKFGEPQRVEVTMSEVLHSPYRGLNVSDGIQYGFTWVIPIYIYLLFSGSVMLFGTLKTLIGAAMALFSLIIARYFDRKRAFGLGKIAYAGNAVFTTLLGLFPTPIVASVVEIGRGLTNTFSVALTATFYRIIKHRSRALAVGRSFYISVGKTIVFTFALLVTYAVKQAGIHLSDVEIARYLVMLSAPFALLSIHLYGKMEREAEALTQQQS